jgi:hypothetical protein
MTQNIPRPDQSGGGRVVSLIEHAPALSAGSKLTRGSTMTAADRHEAAVKIAARHNSGLRSRPLGVNPSHAPENAGVEK